MVPDHTESNQTKNIHSHIFQHIHTNKTHTRTYHPNWSGHKLCLGKRRAREWKTHTHIRKTIIEKPVVSFVVSIIKLESTIAIAQPKHTRSWYLLTINKKCLGICELIAYRIYVSLSSWPSNNFKYFIFSLLLWSTLSRILFHLFSLIASVGFIIFFLLHSFRYIYTHKHILIYFFKMDM